MYVTIHAVPSLAGRFKENNIQLEKEDSQLSFKVVFHQESLWYSNPAHCVSWSQRVGSINWPALQVFQKHLFNTCRLENLSFFFTKTGEGILVGVIFVSELKEI